MNRNYTIILVPGNTAKVWRVKLPVPLTFALLATLTVMLLLGGYGTYSAISLQAEQSGLQNLSTGLLRQHLTTRKAANQVRAITHKLARLEELDGKLRLISDMAQVQRASAVYGVGLIGEARPTATRQADNPATPPADGKVLSRLERELDRLAGAIRQREESLNSLRTHLADRKDEIVRTPYRWPVKGYISSDFGMRSHPLSGQEQLHSGVDIVAPRGTLVFAPADGIVTYSGYDPALGNMVVIDHGYGVITRYGHLKTALVQEGMSVRRGAGIANVGSSGLSTGPHLHYEIRVNDAAINPRSMIIN